MSLQRACHIDDDDEGDLPFFIHMDIIPSQRSLTAHIESILPDNCLAVMLVNHYHRPPYRSPRVACLALSPHINAVPSSTDLNHLIELSLSVNNNNNKEDSNTITDNSPSTTTIFTPVCLPSLDPDGFVNVSIGGGSNSSTSISSCWIILSESFEEYEQINDLRRSLDDILLLLRREGSDDGDDDEFFDQDSLMIRQRKPDLIQVWAKDNDKDPLKVPMHLYSRNFESLETEKFTIQRIHCSNDNRDITYKLTK